MVDTVYAVTRFQDHCELEDVHKAQGVTNVQEMFVLVIGLRISDKNSMLPIFFVSNFTQDLSNIKSCFYHYLGVSREVHVELQTH